MHGERCCARRNLARCRELGDSSAIARALYLLGWLALLKGNFATAHALLEESLVLYRKVGDTGGILVSLFWIGVVASNQCEYARVVSSVRADPGYASGS